MTYRSEHKIIITRMKNPSLLWEGASFMVHTDKD